MPCSIWFRRGTPLCFWEHRAKLLNSLMEGLFLKILSEIFPSWRQVLAPFSSLARFPRSMHSRASCPQETRQGSPSCNSRGGSTRCRSSPAVCSPPPVPAQNRWGRTSTGWGSTSPRCSIRAGVWPFWNEGEPSQMNFLMGRLWDEPPKKTAMLCL